MRCVKGTAAFAQIECPELGRMRCVQGAAAFAAIQCSELCGMRCMQGTGLLQQDCVQSSAGCGVCREQGTGAPCSKTVSEDLRNVVCAGSQSFCSSTVMRVNEVCAGSCVGDCDKTVNQVCIFSVFQVTPDVV